MISERDKKKKLGENIKRYRKERKMTQLDLGEMVGLTASAISYYENARREPSLETIESMASALDVDSQLLLGDEYLNLKFPGLGKQITKREYFIEYLESIGFAVITEINGVEVKDDSPDQTVKIAHGKDVYLLTEPEFEALQGSTLDAVEYELWKHNRKEVKSMNKKLLKSKMALMGDTNATLAAVLGISPQTFSNKMNEYNGAEFTQSEMNGIRIKYRLTDDEFMSLFFADLVS